MGATDMTETRAATFMATETKTDTGNSLRRFTVDFAAAALVFALAAGLFSIGASNAFPAPPPPELSLASALLPPPHMTISLPTFPGMPEGPSTAQTLILLGFAFATLVASNLAIGRHLLRAYASPRRRTWRKG
jgi:hypothetical protein